MATPQHGIFALGTRSHLHLQLDVGPTDEAFGVAPPIETFAWGKTS